MRWDREKIYFNTLDLIILSAFFVLYLLWLFR